MSKVAELRPGSKEHANGLVRVKRRVLLDLSVGLGEVQRISSSVAFAYAVAKTARLIKSELEAIETAFTPLPEFKAWNDARLDVCRRYAEKDDKGNPRSANGAFVIADQSGFDGEIAKVQAQHQSAIDTQTARNAVAEARLDEEIEIHVRPVTLAECPDGLSAQTLGMLWPMLIEPE